MARHSGGSYYAQGTPAFVGGALAGAAIGEAIRTQADFNDCMSATGWIATDVHNQANEQLLASRDQMKAAVEQSNLCMGTAQANPKYAPISSHFRALGTKHFTMEQMSDVTVPTPDQAVLFAAYGDDTEQCREKLSDELKSNDPRAAQALIQANQVADRITLMVVQRQISWGQYARAGEDYSAQLAAGRVPTMPIIAATAETGTSAPRLQNAAAVAPNGAHVCTHDEQVQARIARENGYTGGPNCL